MEAQKVFIGEVAQYLPVERRVMREATETLENMIVALSKYGKPRIAHDGDGEWK